MSRSMTSYVMFMTSQALRIRDVTTQPENMEAKKEYQRVYIFARLQLGEGIQQIHSDLSKLFGGGPWAPQHALDGLESSLMEEKQVEYEHRSEAQKSVRSENTIESVRQRIDSSIREISSNLGPSYGTVQTILLKDLTLKKFCARWVPHILTKNQKRQRVLCARKLIQLLEPNGH